MDRACVGRGEGGGNESNDLRFRAGDLDIIAPIEHCKFQTCILVIIALCSAGSAKRFFNPVEMLTMIM
jgi:hypothetical protein